MRQIVAAILRRHDGRVLICQRARAAVQPLRWEFPGGKVEAGEDERAALQRELREELGIEAAIGRVFARVRHRYPETGPLELAFYEASTGDVPQNLVFESIAWERPERLGTYDFLPADRPVLDLLLKF